ACPPPSRLYYAELEESFAAAQSFPVGTTVSYACRPGYRAIPGRSPRRTCGADLQWSPVEQFCTERSCNHPGELDHGYVHVTNLTINSKATFSCERGFRLIGTDQSTCVIMNKAVGWDRELPFCERIPCEPPPSIANGRYTEAEHYFYQSSVTYSCDDVPGGTDPFSLIGPATIFCTQDEHFNGVWSEQPPQCRVVKCDNPSIENGRKSSGFTPPYRYKASVTFECNPGYFMVGSRIITCQENSTWSPKPACEKTFTYETSEGLTELLIFTHTQGLFDGSFLNLLRVPALFLDFISVSFFFSTPFFPGRSESPGSAPHIKYGSIVGGRNESYSVGDFITIECYPGYTLHGEARIQYIGENQWVPGVPTCQLSKLFFLTLPKVIVAIVVLLAAFWVYKKFFSQNGKRHSTPCTAEYKICK
ncbi:C4b-binding protein alpha chain, partial [Merops nubicus]